MKIQEEYHLLHNSRFYILAFSLLLSVVVFAALRLMIESEQLLFIRLQQAYGLICLLYWYVALMISPLGHAIGKQRMGHINFSRRAIGVSAFFFGLLHGVVALFGQLGGIGQIQYLPDLFKWSLLFGAVAFCILLVLAVTSFDKAIELMTFKRWKLVHRFVYIGGVLVILHIWMIGTHLAYTWAQVSGVLALGLLGGLEIARLVSTLNQKYFHFNRAEAWTMGIALWMVLLALIVSIPGLVQNYHGRHTTHQHSQGRNE